MRKIRYLKAALFLVTFLMSWLIFLVIASSCFVLRDAPLSNKIILCFYTLAVCPYAAIPFFILLLLFVYFLYFLRKESMKINASLSK